ncbi:MAG TPA: hypothetical protein VGB13_04605 [Candidatus Krumholzibacteria bacterium]
MSKAKRQPTCQQPDRDAPRMVCGYPLPCPHHTVVMETGKLTIPHRSPAATSPVVRKRVKAVHRALTERVK